MDQEIEGVRPAGAETPGRNEEPEANPFALLRVPARKDTSPEEGLRSKAPEVETPAMEEETATVSRCKPKTKWEKFLDNVSRHALTLGITGGMSCLTGYSIWGMTQPAMGWGWWWRNQFSLWPETPWVPIAYALAGTGLLLASLGSALIGRCMKNGAMPKPKVLDVGITRR